jgi:hypothetical protein
MPIFHLLDCLLCGLRNKESTRKESLPVARVHYEIEIEGKKPVSSGSQDSISSASQYTARDETRILGTKQLQPEKIPSSLNRAFVVVSKGTYGFRDDPFPEMAHDEEVIISNRATGLNPIDYKSVDYNFCLPEFPWITGREMAGVVEAVSKGVKDIKVGDHVWTSMLLSYPASIMFMSLT